MTHRLLVALSTVIAASAASAASLQPATAPAPTGSAETRYCMRIEPIVGSRMETVRCWTREEWAEQDVDVDAEWAKEGVKVIG